MVIHGYDGYRAPQRPLRAPVSPEGRLTYGVSELLEVSELLVVGALLHPGLHKPRLMAPPLLLLLQLPPPAGGRGWG